MKEKARRDRSREEIRELLDEFRRSEQTQVTFAKRRGLAVSTLQYWLRGARADRKGPVRRGGAVNAPRRLVPVRVIDQPPPSTAGIIELEFPDGGKVRFPAGLAPEVIAPYIEAMKRQC